MDLTPKFGDRFVWNRASGPCIATVTAVYPDGSVMLSVDGWADNLRCKLNYQFSPYVPEFMKPKTACICGGSDTDENCKAFHSVRERVRKVRKGVVKMPKNATGEFYLEA